MDPLSLCLSNEWLPFAEQLEMIAFNVFNCSTYTWRCLPTSFYMLAIDWTAKNRSKLFANNRLKTYNQIFNKEGSFVFFKFCRQRRKTVKLQSQHSNIYLYSTQKDADYICHSVKLSTFLYYQTKKWYSTRSLCSRGCEPMFISMRSYWPSSGFYIHNTDMLLSLSNMGFLFPKVQLISNSSYLG